MRSTLFIVCRTVFAALIVLTAAPDARAFCRTTTSQVPAGYDPAISGCWQQGKPVAWATGWVPYSLSQAASKQVSLADATRIAHLAFDAWNGASCEAGPVSVQAYDDGPVSADAAATDCGLIACDPTIHDPLHVIVFRDDSWPHNDPANTLAITTVTYGVSSAQIFDADIEINSSQHQLSAVEPPPSGAFDLQAILTHEAGHFYGLSHATDSLSIMYAFYEKGRTSLTSDDIDGVCTLYARVPPHGGSSCAAAGGSQTGQAAGGACASIWLVGWMLRMKARKGRASQQRRI